MDDDYGLRSFDPADLKPISWHAGIAMPDFRSHARMVSLDQETVIPKKLAEKFSRKMAERIDDHYLDALNYGIGGTTTVTTIKPSDEGSLTLEKLNDMMAKVQDQLRLPTQEEVAERIAIRDAERAKEAMADMPGFGAFA